MTHQIVPPSVIIGELTVKTAVRIEIHLNDVSSRKVANKGPYTYLPLAVKHCETSDEKGAITHH